MSGSTFMLILLPFTFIEFFYSPWVKAQQAARVPKSVPEDMEGHVVLTHLDAVTAARRDLDAVYYHTWRGTLDIIPNLCR